MSTTEKLAKIYERIVPPAPPTIKGVITGGEVFALYSSIFPNDITKIFLSDSWYEITAISEIRRFVEWDNTNIFPYIAETKDCDDFAAALAGDFAKYPEWSGFPATDIWGSFLGGHAFFTCVAWASLEDRIPRVFYIEPQNDFEIAFESVEGMVLWLLAI